MNSNELLVGKVGLEVGPRLARGRPEATQSDDLLVGKVGPRWARGRPEAMLGQVHVNRAPVTTWMVSEAKLVPRYAFNNVLEKLFRVHAQVSYI